MTKVSSKIKNIRKEVALNTSNFWLQAYLHVFAELNKQVDTKQLDVEIPETVNYLDEVGAKFSKTREDNKESACVPSAAEVVANFYEKLEKDLGVEGLDGKNQNGNSGDNNDKRYVGDKPVVGKQSQAIQKLLTKVKKSNFTALLNAGDGGLSILLQLRKLARAVVAAKQKSLIYSQLIEMDMESCLGGSSSKLEEVLTSGVWQKRLEAFAKGEAISLTSKGFLDIEYQEHCKAYLLNKALFFSVSDAVNYDLYYRSASRDLVVDVELEGLRAMLEFIRASIKLDIETNVKKYNECAEAYYKGGEDLKKKLAQQSMMADANKKLGVFAWWQESLEGDVLVSLSDDGCSMDFNSKLFGEFLPDVLTLPDVLKSARGLNDYINMSVDDLAGLDVLECALVGAYLSYPSRMLGVPLVSKKYLESALEKLNKIKEGVGLDAKAKKDKNVKSDNGLPGVFGEEPDAIMEFEKRLELRLKVVMFCIKRDELLWKHRKEEADSTELILRALYEGRADREVEGFLDKPSENGSDKHEKEDFDKYVSGLQADGKTFIGNDYGVSVLALAIAQRRGKVVKRVLDNLSARYRFVDDKGRPSQFLFDLLVASIIQRNATGLCYNSD